MMIGYPSHHAGDCYRVWDKETGGIHFTPKDPGHEVVCKIDENLDLNIPQATFVSAGGFNHCILTLKELCKFQLSFSNHHNLQIWFVDC